MTEGRCLECGLDWESANHCPDYACWQTLAEDFWERLKYKSAECERLREAIKQHSPRCEFPGCKETATNYLDEGGFNEVRPEYACNVHRKEGAYECEHWTVKAPTPARAVREARRGGGAMIAALFVETDGAYFNLPEVDPWDVARDARSYAGPHPVVAHPPCERWGRYWFGGPSVRVRKVRGDDGGCFKAAIAAVRQFGGVLEHPEGSSAWGAHGLIAPPKSGGWHSAGDFTGWTCCVEQGHYGHPARKATWLYAVGVQDLPQLKWGKSEARGKLEESFRTKEAAIAARRAPGFVPVKRLSRAERIDTPIPFRDLLIDLARRAPSKESSGEGEFPSKPHICARPDCCRAPSKED